MKKSAFPALLLLIAAGVPGCPLYDHEDAGCYADSDCAPGFFCDQRDGLCYADDGDACRKPTDCGTNETCSRFGTCTTGDCHYAGIGCVRGYVCSSESGRWECVSSTGEGGASGGGGAPGAAGASSDAGAPSEAGSGATENFGGSPTGDAGAPGSASPGGASGGGGEPSAAGGTP